MNDLTNGVERLPPRREVRPSVNARAWRLVAAAALLLASASVALNVALFYVQRAEATERRDQNCRQFEGDHRDDVADLVASYYYVRHPFVDAKLNAAVVLGVPERERAGLRDNAPTYCDEPGVGLPEPDPCFPHRPRVLGPGPKVPFQAECKRVPGPGG